MCFKDNVSFFKMFNVAFFLIHLSVLVACFITYSAMNGDLPVYYNIEVSEQQSIEIKLLFVPISMHFIALLFHFSFFLKASDIVELTIPKNFTNPYHWFYQFIVDGVAFMGVMFIHGFKQIETVGIVLALYASIIVLCFYQDQYMNRGGQFRPTLSPHTFAIPLYICMVIFIAFKSTEHISGSERLNIAIVTSISLFQSGLMFIIQKFHINYNKVSDMDDIRDRIGEESGTSAIENAEDGEELTMPIDEKNQILDLEISEMRRAIKYDLMHYLNSIIFHIAISWIIINLTRTNQTLEH